MTTVPSAHVREGLQTRQWNRLRLWGRYSGSGVLGRGAVAWMGSFLSRRSAARRPRRAPGGRSGVGLGGVTVLYPGGSKSGHASH
jgi:hypothetical protein